MKATISSSDQVSDAESVAADELRQFIERIERLEEEKAGLLGDIKEVYAEAKGRGFDTKTMRRIISIRKKDHAERTEEEAILELYMEALGMIADTPLGRAAVGREFAETKVTISGPGIAPIETTGAGISRAAASIGVEAHAKARVPRLRPDRSTSKTPSRRVGDADAPPDPSPRIRNPGRRDGSLALARPARDAGGGGPERWRPRPTRADCRRLGPARPRRPRADRLLSS